jgi:hypothetical protein
VVAVVRTCSSPRASSRRHIRSARLEAVNWSGRDRALRREPADLVIVDSIARAIR